jgi:hypothetical protein
MKTLTPNDKINIRAHREKIGIGCTTESKAMDKIKYGQYVYGGQCLYQIREAKK